MGTIASHLLNVLISTVSPSLRPFVTKTKPKERISVTYSLLIPNILKRTVFKMECLEFFPDQEEAIYLKLFDQTLSRQLYHRLSCKMSVTVLAGQSEN